MPFSRTSTASCESKAARDSCSDPGLLGRVRAAVDVLEQGDGSTSDAALVPAPPTPPPPGAPADVPRHRILRSFRKAIALRPTPHLLPVECNITTHILLAMSESEIRHAVSDVPFQPAVEQSRALAAGEISSRELVELYLERITIHNTALNAVVTLDAERARREAGEADAARAAGRDLGPLHGVPITVKDSFETAGMRTVCGRTDLKDYVPDLDAEAVKRLRSAGAVIMGKSNMPPGNQDVQADNPVFGPSSNPWDTTRTSGGSAGGGAVATAAGLTSFDFGSEIGGSTRIPSHFNGLYGHKSTWRSIPLIGHVPYGPGTGRWTDADMACGGAQVRDARDLVPILRATVGAADYDGRFQLHARSAARDQARRLPSRRLG